jgi:signal peptidase II
MTPSSLRGDAWRLFLVLVTLVADQVTKYAARAHYSLPDGTPDYFKVTQVAGEWLQFRLVYNSGAAFGMKPQSVLPFLHPTLFFALFSTVAIGVLFYYYRKLSAVEGWQKTGVALILSGAFGNLIDRLMLHKVTDFIDVGLPGGARWPTFNIADSCVCVGVGLILAAPLFLRKAAPAMTAAGSAPAVPPSGGDPAPEVPTPPPSRLGGAQGPSAP